MSILEHFKAPTAKPGMSFSAKSTAGFAGKLHTAIAQNFHGFGSLKDSPAAIEAIKSQVLKQQHYIRQGGLSKFQAQKMIAKIQHETYSQGEHLSAHQHETLKKIGEHLSKSLIRNENQNQADHHGITTLSANTHTVTASRVGDQTKITSQGEIHGSGGIASAIQHKANSVPTDQPSHKPVNPIIKLSV